MRYRAENLLQLLLDNNNIGHPDNVEKCFWSVDGQIQIWLLKSSDKSYEHEHFSISSLYTSVCKWKNIYKFEEKC